MRPKLIVPINSEQQCTVYSLIRPAAIKQRPDKSELMIKKSGLIIKIIYRRTRPLSDTLFERRVFIDYISRAMLSIVWAISRDYGSKHRCNNREQFVGNVRYRIIDRHLLIWTSIRSFFLFFFFFFFFSFRFDSTTISCCNERSNDRIIVRVRYARQKKLKYFKN